MAGVLFSWLGGSDLKGANHAPRLEHEIGPLARILLTTEWARKIRKVIVLDDYERGSVNGDRAEAYFNWLRTAIGEIEIEIVNVAGRVDSDNIGRIYDLAHHEVGARLPEDRKTTHFNMSIYFNVSSGMPRMCLAFQLLSKLEYTGSVLVDAFLNRHKTSSVKSVDFPFDVTDSLMRALERYRARDLWLDKPVGIGSLESRSTNMVDPLGTLEKLKSERSSGLVFVEDFEEAKAIARYLGGNTPPVPCEHWNTPADFRAAFHGISGHFKNCKDATMVLQNIETMSVNAQTCLVDAMDKDNLQVRDGRPDAIIGISHLSQEHVGSILRLDVLGLFGEHVVIPPLRKRPADIKHAAEQLSAREALPVDEAAMAALVGFPWSRLGQLRTVLSKLLKEERKKGAKSLSRDAVITRLAQPRIPDTFDPELVALGPGFVASEFVGNVKQILGLRAMKECNQIKSAASDLLGIQTKDMNSNRINQYLNPSELKNKS